ncbi:MAG: hypothetical protein ACI9XC_002587 [Gammaproteobacteria bacterium]|jgi:hypothetical protein
MWRLLTVIFLSGISFIATSGDIEVASVTNHEGECQVHLSVRVSGDKETIFRIATDYEQLARLSDIIIESGLIERFDQDGNKIPRRKLLTKTCVLFFCFFATLVEDVTEVGNGIIRTIIIPEESNFIYGNAEWEILASDQSHSIINFNSRFKPDFWIPPLVGPLFIKKMVLNKTQQAINKIETIAINEQVQ